MTFFFPKKDVDFGSFWFILVHFGSCRLIRWWMEVAISRMSEGGDGKYTVIVDRSSMGSSSSDMEGLKYASSIISSNYPERLHTAIVHPVNLIFWSLWKVAQFFLDPITRDKVKPLVYQSAIREYVPSEHILSHLGGEGNYEYDHTDLPDDPTVTVVSDEGGEQEEQKS